MPTAKLVRCPRCSKTIRVSPEFLNKPVRCPACQEPFVPYLPSTGTPPIAPPLPEITLFEYIGRAMVSATRALLAWCRSTFAGIARIPRAYRERQQKAAEREAMKAKHRELIRTEREAQREQAHRQWLTTLHREMASLSSDGVAMKALHAGDQLAGMVSSILQLGAAGFNEAEFSANVRAMWSNLQDRSMESLPSLRQELDLIVKGMPARCFSPASVTWVLERHNH